jgi:Fic family protein
MNNIIDEIMNNSSYFEDFITRSTYHSNAIEGSTLSFAETYALIFNKDTVPINTSAREIYEAINHKYALNYIMTTGDSDLTAQIIKDIAIIINKNINEINDFRHESVFIRGAEYIPPKAYEVPTRITYLIDSLNNTVYDSIWDRLADFHINFERIHPFIDGNGRTGRLLVNRELLKYNMLPIVITKDDRIRYFEYLGQQDTHSLSMLFESLYDNEIKRAKEFNLHYDQGDIDSNLER